MCVCVCVCVCVLCVCVHACVCACAYVYVCVWVCVYMCCLCCRYMYMCMIWCCRYMFYGLLFLPCVKKMAVIIQFVHLADTSSICMHVCHVHMMCVWVMCYVGTSFDGRGLATFSGYMFLCGFINQATVQFHTYNPSGILLYQINSVMTDILEVKLHGGLPWLMFAQCGLWTSCRWIQQYQNLQRWSVAHCELQNSSVMWSLYVGVSVVQSPPVTSVMARGV